MRDRWSFRPSSQSLETRGQSRFLIGCLLVSIGTMTSAGGGSWDITNHLLNRPETFFSIPHGVLYTGAGLALAGAVFIAIHRRCQGLAKSGTTTKLPSTLIFVGVGMLISAGPVDYLWHSAFGLDGLLSPPHSVLLSGMIISSVGSLFGLVYQSHHHRYRYYNDSEAGWPGAGNKNSQLFGWLFIIVGIAPVLVSASAMVHMFSLPFSDTAYFNFNPNPVAGAIVATLGFPFVTSLLLYASGAFAGKRRFGMISAAGATFILVSVASSIVPNEHLVPTLPFFLANMIPIMAADAIFSFVPSKASTYLAGAIIGSAFLMINYPLITYTYNQVLDGSSKVLPSAIPFAYFGMIGRLYPLVVGPAVASGILGAIAGQRLAARIELIHLA